MSGRQQADIRIAAASAADVRSGPEQAHRDRVGLFARRAARRPDPHRALLALEHRQDRLAKMIEMMRLTEEMCVVGGERHHHRMAFLRRRYAQARHSRMNTDRGHARAAGAPGATGRAWSSPR